MSHFNENYKSEMFELIDVLIEVLDKKANVELKKFLSQFPSDASWFLISDYCIEDENKYNDVITFSLLLNHDTISNIKEFVKNISPQDLKKTKFPSKEIITYLNSRVVFHFSIVIPRIERLLKEYLTTNNMLFFLREIESSVINAKSINPQLKEYYQEVELKLKNIFKDSEKKSFNSRLLRKIFLVSTLGAVIIYLIQNNAKPKNIAWISDRDSIISSYSGFSFDLMYLLYEIVAYNKIIENKVNILFEEPEYNGINYLDEFIRIPDYLVGTLASINLDERKELNSKHQTMFDNSIVNSSNHITLKIVQKNSILSVFNVKWVI